MENKFFTTSKVNNYVTRITGLAFENAYLIEGSKMAVLFDGLSGVGSLKAFVRELTDLPVIFVLSHAHPDHIGAAFEYGECFMHPDDIRLMYTDFVSGAEERLNFVSAPTPFGTPQRTSPVMEDVILPTAVKTYPVYDGYVFDLGDVQLKVIHVPGHTRGTIVLLDMKDRKIYSGDAINPNTLLHLPGATSVEEYKESVLYLKTYQKDFDEMYGGHGQENIPASIIDDALMLCDKILDGTDDAVEEISHNNKVYVAAKRGPHFFPAYGGFSNIVYTKENIRGKRENVVITGNMN